MSSYHLKFRALQMSALQWQNSVNVTKTPKKTSTAPLYYSSEVEIEPPLLVALVRNKISQKPACRTSQAPYRRKPQQFPRLTKRRQQQQQPT